MKYNPVNKRNNAAAAVDDMSINMWNGSPELVVGSESQIGTSQTNMSSVVGMAARKAMQG